MNKLEKLELLEYMLRNHSKIFKETEFNIGLWSESDSISPETLAKSEVEDTITAACGSSACALGSAASYEPFTKLGLTLQCEVGEEWDGEKIIYSLVPRYKSSNGFCAGEVFFDISYEESEWLFSPNQYCDEENYDSEDDYEPIYPAYITADMVADRVAEIIAGSDNVLDHTFLGASYGKE